MYIIIITVLIILITIIPCIKETIEVYRGLNKKDRHKAIYSIYLVDKKEYFLDMRVASCMLVILQMILYILGGNNPIYVLIPYLLSTILCIYGQKNIKRKKHKLIPITITNYILFTLSLIPIITTNIVNPYLLTGLLIIYWIYILYLTVSFIKMVK